MQAFYELSKLTPAQRDALVLYADGMRPVIVGGQSFSSRSRLIASMVKMKLLVGCRANGAADQGNSRPRFYRLSRRGREMLASMIASRSALDVAGATLVPSAPAPAREVETVC